MTKPGVSFVVPVYNKAAWLPDVLEAIKNQIGDFEREYVFVDDGSSDASMDIVHDLTHDWGNVKIHVQDNHGSAHATNRGIELCEMEYVKFVDADDLLSTHATQTLLNALSDSDACLAYGDVCRYESRDDIDLDAFEKSPNINRIAQPLIPALRNSMFNPTQFLARLDSLKMARGCDERVVHSQEYSLTLRMARLAPFLKVDAPVAFLPKHVPGSLGVNQGRQLRRVTLAVANFVRDYPDLPNDIKTFACRRVAGRAWKFQKRNHGATLLSPWFWRYMKSKLPGFHSGPDFMDECLDAFE